ncbi:MAG: hypothetical protein H7343_06695 [Undibacterium sp.]|nr:hypothetical protein [Opitutaceae bacterium]
MGAIALLAFALALGLAGLTLENRKLHLAIGRLGSGTPHGAAALRAQLGQQSRRLAEGNIAVTQLLDKAQEVKVAQARSTEPRRPISAQEAVEVAMEQGARLGKEGKFQEALDGYLGCYRELHAMRPGTPESQRLMVAMKNLGRVYPGAMAALGELRDAAIRRMQTQPAAEELPFEIALLNERLGEGQRTLAVFDSLPPGDRRRQTVAMVARDSFVEARRYEDAFLGKPFAYMLGWIDAGSSELAKVDPQRQAGIRESVIEGTLTNIEVLTGAGRVDDARRLTEKLLTFDRSDSTRALLERHVARARPPGN